MTNKLNYKKGIIIPQPPLSRGKVKNYKLLFPLDKEPVRLGWRVGGLFYIIKKIIN